MGKKLHKPILIILFVLLYLTLPEIGQVQNNEPEILFSTKVSNANLYTLTWHPENDWLIFQDRESYLTFYDIKSNQPLAELEMLGNTNVLEFSPNGVYLASMTSWFLNIWDIERNTLFIKLDLGGIDPEDSHYGLATDLAWVGEDKIAFAHDYKLSILNISTNTLETFSPEELNDRAVFSIDWHSEGQLALATRTVGLSEIIFFDVESNSITDALQLEDDEYFNVPHPPYNQSLEWHPDGNLIAVINMKYNGDSVIDIWNIKTKKVETLLPVSQTQISGLSWHPAGTLLAIGYISSQQSQNIIRLGDVNLHRFTMELKGFFNYLANLVWNKDGNLLASVYYDSNVVVWKIPNDQNFN